MPAAWHPGTRLPARARPGGGTARCRPELTQLFLPGRSSLDTFGRGSRRSYVLTCLQRGLFKPCLPPPPSCLLARAEAGHLRPPRRRRVARVDSGKEQLAAVVWTWRASFVNACFADILPFQVFIVCVFFFFFLLVGQCAIPTCLCLLRVLSAPHRFQLRNKRLWLDQNHCF